MRTEDRGDIEHGTFGGYNGYRCRCRQCKDFRAWHARQYRARLRKERLAEVAVLAQQAQDLALVAGDAIDGLGHQPGPTDALGVH